MQFFESSFKNVLAYVLRGTSKVFKGTSYSQEASYNTGLKGVFVKPFLPLMRQSVKLNFAGDVVTHLAPSL